MSNIKGHYSVTRHRGEFEESLTDKQKELLDKMMDNRNEYDSLAKAAVVTLSPFYIPKFYKLGIIIFKIYKNHFTIFLKCDTIYLV